MHWQFDCMLLFFIIKSFLLIKVRTILEASAVITYCLGLGIKGPQQVCFCSILLDYISVSQRVECGPQ